MSDNISDGDTVWFNETGMGTPVFITFAGRVPRVTVTTGRGKPVWHGPKVGEPIYVKNPQDLPEFVKRVLDSDGTSNFF
jgi:hypothetical protein